MLYPLHKVQLYNISLRSSVKPVYQLAQLQDVSFATSNFKTILITSKVFSGVENELHSLFH